MYLKVNGVDDRQWHMKFAVVPKKINENLWIWLEPYEERLARSRWLSTDGSIPIDGAAAFDFERRCRRGFGTVTKYQCD